MKSSKSNTSNPARDEIDYNNEAGEAVGYTADGQPVVASPGDGALTDLEHKQDERLENTQSPFESARTSFRANQAAPDKIDFFERLWKLQHQWDDDKTSRRTYKDKINIGKALSNAIGLSKEQERRVLGIIAGSSGRRFNQYGGIAALALGAIGFVGDQDAEDLDDRFLGSEKFDRLCDQHDVDGSSAVKKVKEIYRESNR